MVHASGSSQIGLARKNPDENPRNGNPPNQRPNKARYPLRYSCAGCVGWLRLAARVASLGALLGALTQARTGPRWSCGAAADLARDERHFRSARRHCGEKLAQRTHRILRGTEIRQGPRFATFLSKRNRRRGILVVGRRKNGDEDAGSFAPILQSEPVARRGQG
jgi:hypothetical protein